MPREIDESQDRFNELWRRVMDIMDSDKAEEFLDLLEQRLAEKVAEKEKEITQ